MSYTVKLKVFEGPLDLLLYLIKKNEIDIYDIPIAEITDQYLEYIELMRSLNLDVAGEFLVMASTLIYIKSRMLLPPTEDPGDEVEEDPRKELVERLLEYKRFKEAAEWLAGRPILGQDTFARSSLVMEVGGGEEERGEDLSVLLLLEAFKGLLERVEREEPLEIEIDRFSMVERMKEVLEVLSSDGAVDFSSLVKDISSRTMVVVTFLALLELVRLRMVTVYQIEPFGRIVVKRINHGEG